MTTADLSMPARPAAHQTPVVPAVPGIMGTVVGLTFLFGFGRSRRVRGFLMGVAEEPVGQSGLVGACASGSGACRHGVWSSIGWARSGSGWVGSRACGVGGFEVGHPV